MQSSQGRYNIVKKEDISSMVGKLSRNGYIRKRYVDEEYTEYYELKIGDTDQITVLKDAKPLNYPRNKHYTDYTDVDWAEFLAHTDPASLKDSAWMKILPVLDHVGCTANLNYPARQPTAVGRGFYFTYQVALTGYFRIAISSSATLSPAPPSSCGALWAGNMWLLLNRPSASASCHTIDRHPESSNPGAGFTGY